MRQTHERSRRIAASDRFVISLAGLRLTEHRKNPPELVGMTIPWMRVIAGNQRAQVYTADWEVFRSKRLFFQLPLSRQQTRLFRRLNHRAKRLALETGRFDIPMKQPKFNRVVGGVGVLLLSACAVWMIVEWVLPYFRQTYPRWSTWNAHEWLVETAALLVGIVTIMLYPALGLLVYFRISRSNTRHVVVTGHGIDAVMLNGDRVVASWDDVVRIDSESGEAVATLRLGDGTVIRGHFRPAKFVLDHHRQRLIGPPQSKSVYRVLIINFVGLQIVALVGLGLILSGLAKNSNRPVNPWLMYAILGWIGPLALNAIFFYVIRADEKEKKLLLPRRLVVPSTSI